MATQTHPKFVRWAVMLGIVIALNLFFFVARSLILPEPLFENYCPTRTQPAATEQTCVAQDGVWIGTPDDASVTAVVKPNPEGYCDLFQKCQPQYDEAHKQFAMYSFVIMVGLGILSIIAGVVPMGSSIVSTGLSYGGVLALIIGATGYWGEAGNLLKLAISAIALIALIYIGIRRFKD
jgi:hypothetical protein